MVCVIGLAEGSQPGSGTGCHRPCVEERGRHIGERLLPGIAIESMQHAVVGADDHQRRLAGLATDVLPITVGRLTGGIGVRHVVTVVLLADELRVGVDDVAQHRVAHPEPRAVAQQRAIVRPAQPVEAQLGIRSAVSSPTHAGLLRGGQVVPLECSSGRAVVGEDAATGRRGNFPGGRGAPGDIAHRAILAHIVGEHFPGPVRTVVARLEDQGVLLDPRRVGSDRRSRTDLFADRCQRRTQGGVQALRIRSRVVLAGAVPGGIPQHLVIQGKADRIGTHVLLRKSGVVEADAGQIVARGPQIDIEGELGDIVQIECRALAGAAAFRVGPIGVNPLHGRKPVPVGNVVVPAHCGVVPVRIGRGEAAVMGRQTIAHHDAEVLLAAVLNGAGVIALATALETTQATKITRNLIIGFGQRGVGLGRQAVDAGQ
ncbi:hypothetical protein D3C78_833720 [compost metagenome]